MEEPNVRGSPHTQINSNGHSSNFSHDYPHNGYESESSPDSGGSRKSRFPPELQASILLALFHLHFVCGICNEVIIDCICLPCGHNFCTHCLQQWFLFNRICPMCFNSVKDNFKLQRIYCIDEFLAELYQPVHDLSTTLFGSLQSGPHASPPKLHRTASEIQASIRNTRIMNSTTPEQRLNLKKLRREQTSNCPDHLNRMSEYSVLEHQTELFGGLHSVNLTSVVQFFLFFVTAYITYEGGDSVENDYILLMLFTLLVWFVIFMGVMRYVGYEGSFTELLLQLNFIEFRPHEDNVQIGEDVEEDLSDDEDDHSEENDDNVNLSDPSIIPLDWESDDELVDLSRFSSIETLST